MFVDVKHHVYLLYAAADGDDDDDDDDDVGLNVLRCRADSIVIRDKTAAETRGSFMAAGNGSLSLHQLTTHKLQTLGLAAAGRLVGAKYSQCTPPNANTKTRLSATATATPN